MLKSAAKYYLDQYSILAMLLASYLLNNLSKVFPI